MRTELVPSLCLVIACREPSGGVAARTFITRRYHDDPGLPQCWSVVVSPD